MKIFCLSAALLFPFVVAEASTPETTIKVMVRNEAQNPVPNSAVILDFLGSRQALKFGMHRKTHWEVHTNQEGFAHFPPIPEGTIQLQIIDRKYQTYGQKLDIDGVEKLIEITLHPQQKQYSAHPDLKPADAPK